MLAHRNHHVIEAMRKARTGKPHDEEARQKMSEAAKGRGSLVPGTKLWTAGEDELVRTLPAKEVAARTGRTLGAVYDRRRELGMPACVHACPHDAAIRFDAREGTPR